MTKEELNMDMIYEKASNGKEMKIRKKIETDIIFLQDQQDEQELEKRYESLPLRNEHRWTIDDYCACTCSKFSRAIELAYMAGVEAALDVIEKNIA